MNLHIDDLKLSSHTKNTLHELGFTMVSDLEGQDYISLILIQKFPLKCHCVYSIIQELNDAGYLLPRTMQCQFTMSLCPKGFYMFLREIISVYLSQLSVMPQRGTCLFAQSRRADND